MVNVELHQLFDELTDLKEAISESLAVSDRERFDAAVDIETLKDRLAKDTEKTKRLWPAIEKAAPVAA